jgi:hypothetical protein
MMQSNAVWAHCGSCKKAISFNSKYYACDISGCRKAAYCSLDCFSMHTPVMRHKDAWATEKRAPATAESVPLETTQRRVVPSITMNDTNIPHDTLIVASKLKDYIRAKSGGMNTSANVIERLSDLVRHHCDKAIETARSDGRKTVMDRDFQA